MVVSFSFGGLLAESFAFNFPKTLSSFALNRMPQHLPESLFDRLFFLSQFFHITLASSFRFSIFPLFFCIDNSSIPATWIPHWIPTVCMMECGMRRDGEDESESSWKKYNFPWVAKQKIMKLCFIKLQQQIDFLLILLYMCGEREEKEVGCISQKKSPISFTISLKFGDKLRIDDVGAKENSIKLVERKFINFAHLWLPFFSLRTNSQLFSQFFSGKSSMLACTFELNENIYILLLVQKWNFRASANERRWN